MDFLQKFSSVFRADNEGECFLALDIGTTSVKAAVFRAGHDEKKKPQAIILGVGKSLIKSENVREESFDEFIESCREAKKEAENMAGIDVKKTILGVSGQFAKIRTSKEIFQRKDFSKPISLAETRGIIQKIQWRILNAIRKEEKEENNVEGQEVKLIGGRALDIKIDGYKVINPIGFNGKELSFNILNIYTFSSCLKFFRKIAKSLGIRIETVIADWSAVMEATADNIFNANNLGDISCFFIDCGGKITDISLAHQGFLSGPKTVSFGGESLTNRLKNKIYLTEEEADKLKTEYSSGSLPKAIKQKVGEIISADLALWIKGIEMALKDFSFDNLPCLMLIFGGNSLLPDIKIFLEDIAWQEKFNFPQLVKARMLDANDISGVDDRTNLLVRCDDIPILSLASFGVKLKQRKAVIDSILEKVIGLM